MNGLINIDGAAELFGVSRNTIADRRRRHANFPQPAAVVSRRGTGGVCVMFRESELVSYVLCHPFRPRSDGRARGLGRRRFNPLAGLDALVRGNPPGSFFAGRST